MSLIGHSSQPVPALEDHTRSSGIGVLERGASEDRRAEALCHGRNIPLGYLRTFLTLVVVAHHAVLAYHNYAPPTPHALADVPMMWMAFPVSDSAKMPGADLLVGFNDIFFMSLMFMVSGMFAWPSLQRKGAARFIKDRAIKLGLPFILCALFLAPLAYYPTYLAVANASDSPTGIADFVHQWLALGREGGVWPAGPAWFLWVLLMFDLLAAAVYAVVPGVGAALGRVCGNLSRRPILYFVALIVVSALAYLPMAAAFDAQDWRSFGPFWVQISRLAHYAAYFVAGMGLGAAGLSQGLFAPAGKLARRWPLWVLASLGGFVIAIAAFLIIMSTFKTGGPGPILSTLGNFAFVLSCACSSLACIALFVRFAGKPNRFFDSLSTHAYGIFLLHYACVSWLQYALLGSDLPGAAKAALVFIGAVAASWGVMEVLRRARTFRAIGPTGSLREHPIA